MNRIVLVNSMATTVITAVSIFLGGSNTVGFLQLGTGMPAFVAGGNFLGPAPEEPSCNPLFVPQSFVRPPSRESRIFVNC